MFQSTPSGGKATSRAHLFWAVERVSIHAFRGEGDSPSFTPFPVHGGFQSTPSGGKATAVATYLDSASSVSIHAFRGEGDPIFVDEPSPHVLFQSTPSGGKATECIGIRRVDRWFQSTPSGGKATAKACGSLGSSTVSIHAFRGEGDERVGVEGRFQRVVSIHAFRGEGDTCVHR